MAETTGAGSPEVPPPAEKTRNPVLDGLKYAAAAGIVLHHVSARAGGLLGSFLVAFPVAALFLFFAISGYLHGDVGVRGPKWLGRRVLRLAVPYVVWSVFYLAWRNLPILYGARAFAPPAWEVVFFAGAHGILWSLAMLVYCAVVIELFVHNAAQRRIALGVAVLATLAIYWFGPNGAIAASPMANFFYAPRWFIAYLGGMEIRAIGAKKTPTWFYTSAVAASMLIVGLFRLENSLFSPSLVLTVETALWVTGALLILYGAVSGNRWFGVERLAWGKDYLVGVYVSHVLWLEIIAAAVPPTQSMLGAPWIIAAWAFCMLMSTLTVAALRSNRITRWAVA